MFKLKLVVIVAVTGLLLIGGGVAMAATGNLPDPVKTLLPSSGSDTGQPGQAQAVGSGAVQPQAPSEPAAATEAAEPVESTEAAEPVEPAEAAETGD